MTQDDFDYKAANILKRGAEWAVAAESWIEFHDAVFGVRGIIRAVFETSAELIEFEKTPQYAELQEMMAKLQQQSEVRKKESNRRVVTIRVPTCVHEALLAEAHDRRTTLNKLCTAKLLQPLREKEKQTERSEV